ncbi:hypothetical protein [Stenotrophomonas sp. KCTC 12332]|uniref:hypothetical protein n=1 Tax=Stenotrophomonas sp. KCTC 12332 TaxID=1793721 RepID=UPI000ACAE86B|nr:hypothetical protein [Stenotrophomonas sp. KCTC 12332]
MQIADRLKIQAKVITDNDGDIAVVQERYAEHINASITIPTKAPIAGRAADQSQLAGRTQYRAGQDVADEVALLST